jgi:hypothetical protein
MKELFTGKPIEINERIPQRPLEGLSTFVVETLPTIVEGVRSKRITNSLLEVSARNLVEKLSIEKVNGLLAKNNGFESDSQLDLATIDLKFLETAMLHTGCQLPEQLSSLVEVFAQAADQPNIITYEELIFVNPRHDPRMFTMGHVGESEFSFYQGHNRIERVLEGTIAGVKCAFWELSKFDNVAFAVDELNRCAQSMDQVLGYTRSVGFDMPKEDFVHFRMFFNPTPLRSNHKGPSGLYTAAIPTVEIWLAGENLPVESLNFIRENLRYFPRKGRKEMIQAIESIPNGNTITAQIKRLGEPTELVESAQRLSGQLREFRGMHYKATKHQIPEAIRDNLKGSGGTDPGTFLRGRMKIRHII